MTQDPFSAGAAEAAAAEFLGGGATVAAKFPRDGFAVEGTVTGYRLQQQRHQSSGEPLFWSGGKPVEQSKVQFMNSAQPVMQLLVDLQGEPTGVTYEWDSTRLVFNEVPLANDDGMRTAYVKGELQKALAKELKRHNVVPLVPKIGSYVKMIRTKTVKAPVGRKYLYEVEYTPPEANEHAAAAAMDAGEDPFA